VVGGGVEGVEAVEFGFNLGAVGEGEAESAEDLNRAVFDDGERVKGADGEFAGRHGDIESGHGSGIAGVLELLFAGLECSADGLAGGIEGGAKFGLFLVGEVPHFSGKGIERAFFAEELDAGFLEGGFGGSCFDGGEGFSLDLGGLLGHAGVELRERRGLVNDGERGGGSWRVAALPGDWRLAVGG